MSTLKARAVLYLRVSGRSQVDTDYDPEGLSIPAQREICKRKAESLGLDVVGEYVELGRSATTVQGRPEYQAMIQRISTRRDVDYVIVYMLSRLNRNRTDDVLVMLQMDAVGAKLISATENIDDSPTGQMTRGILAAVNQYRSASEGQDIARKMAHKARLGGTIGPAPLGYRNVKEDVDGRQVSAVAVDEVRGPLIREGFELYASGDYSLKRLCQAMADRGLTTRQTRARPTANVVSANKWHQMLRNPYYMGVVVYQGEQYPGRHEPLVSAELFDRVQQVLAERSAPTRRDRTHFHYLKKQLYCGRCHRADRVGKLVYTEASGVGGVYSYFFCVNRKAGTCDLDYLPVPQVEDHVVSYYGAVRLSSGFVQLMEHELEAAVTHEQETMRTFHQRAQTRLKELELAEERLIDLIADGAMTAQKVRARLAKLNLERARLTSDLDKTAAELANGGERLREAMRLVADVPNAYARASDEVRALLNDGLFKKLYIEQEGVDDSQWQPPFDELVEADAAWGTQGSGLGREEHRQTRVSGTHPRVVDLFRPGAGTTRASWNNPGMAEDTRFELVRA